MSPPPKIIGNRLTGRIGNSATVVYVDIGKITGKWDIGSANETQDVTIEVETDQIPYYIDNVEILVKIHGSVLESDAGGGHVDMIPNVNVSGCGYGYIQKGHVRVGKVAVHLEPKEHFVRLNIRPGGDSPWQGGTIEKFHLQITDRIEGYSDDLTPDPKSVRLTIGWQLWFEFSKNTPFVSVKYLDHDATIDQRSGLLTIKRTVWELGSYYNPYIIDGNGNISQLDGVMDVARISLKLIEIIGFKRISSPPIPTNPLPSTDPADYLNRTQYPSGWYIAPHNDVRLGRTIIRSNTKFHITQNNINYSDSDIA